MEPTGTRAGSSECRSEDLCEKEGQRPFLLNTLILHVMKQKSKKMEFITKYSESVQKGSFEVNNKPSMTEPDNAMSIPEIIARFTRGQGIMVNQTPWTSGNAPEGDYEGDNNFAEIVPGLVAPQPDPQPAPQPEPQPEPQPAPQPAPQPEPQPAPQPAK